MAGRLEFTFDESAFAAGHASRGPPSDSRRRRVYRRYHMPPPFHVKKSLRCPEIKLTALPQHIFMGCLSRGRQAVARVAREVTPRPRLLGL